MKQPTYRFPRRWLAGSTVLIVLVIILGFWLSYYLESEIEERIISANGSTSKIRVNLLTRSIHIDNLRWTSNKVYSNKTYQDHLAFRKISVSGIHVITLLWDKQVVIQHLHLDSGNLLYSIPDISYTVSHTNGELPSIGIRNISISHAQFVVKQDTLNYVSGYMHGEVRGFHIQQNSISRQPYSAEAVELTMDSLQVNHHHHLIQSLKRKHKHDN